MFLDDFTDAKVAQQHGIVRSTAADTESLIKALAGKSFTLGYTVIAESAASQPVVEISLPAFNAAVAPVPVANPEKLDLRTLTEVSEKFFAQKSKYDAALNSWLQTARAETEAYKKNVMVEQMRTASIFDRNEVTLGADYRRSDVAGAIIQSLKRLSATRGIRILILNSDCEDSPLGKPSRKTAFTPAELPEDIILFFINTSRLPERSPIFAGLKNRILTADSIQNAATIIATAAQEDWKPFLAPSFLPSSPSPNP